MSDAYSDPSGLLESNKPPSIDYVTITSDGSPGYEVGDILTANIFGLDIPDGSSAGTHLYQWYRAGDNQDTGLVAISGAEASTHTLITADKGKRHYVVATPVQTGSGANLQGTPVKSFYTIQISEPLPAIYQTLDPEHLSLNGDWDAGAGTNGEWPNSGKDGGVWTGTAGAVPTVGANGEAVFDGTKGIDGTVVAYGNTGWAAWVKFNSSDLSAIQMILEMTANRSIEILTSGSLRIKSTTGFTTVGQVVADTNYNLVVSFDTSGTLITVRMEEDDGTAIINDETGTWNTNEPTNGAATLGQDVTTHRLVGAVSEWGGRNAPVSGTNRTDLVTRLKGLTL